MTLVATDPAAAAAEDLEIVRRIGSGDRAALAELYERHGGWLTVRLQRRCRNTELVDTALQDTFLAVWKQADRYRPDAEVGAWLWTIAIRRLIDQLRRRPPPDPVADVAPIAGVIAHEIPLALGHTELGAAFAALEPDLQAVMAATALDGLTNKEAAHLLGIPVGTVKSRLSRARQILQEQLR
jgi:RNA polymerase sigma-70 factor, ECF subfamily